VAGRDAPTNGNSGAGTLQADADWAAGDNMQNPLKPLRAKHFARPETARFDLRKA
jgi:hypothetical protein